MGRRIYFFFLFAVIALQVYAQSDNSTKNTCGCDYLSMCNYTAKRNFGGKAYYGINRSEERGRYYRCENGIITLLWVEEVDVYSHSGSDYDIFSKTHSTIHYYDTEERYYTEEVLNYNLPVGGKWKVPETPWEYLVIAKNKTITVNGRQFKNVIQVRCTSGETMPFEQFAKDFYAKGSDKIYYEGRAISQAEDKYWAKGYGFLKSENVMDTVRINLTSNQISGKEAQASVEQITKHFLSTYAGVYANGSKQQLDIVSNGDSIKYMGLSQGGKVVFVFGIGKGPGQIDAYTRACDGKLNINGTMYDYKVTVSNCQGKEADFNPKVKTVRFQNEFYQYLGESVTLTFPGTQEYGYNKPTIIFPDNFSHSNFNAYNSGNTTRTNSISNLSASEIADEVKRSYKIQEGKLVNGGSIEQALLGTWIFTESVGSKIDSYYDVYRFFKDGTFEQTIFMDGRPERPAQYFVRDKGLWRIINKKLVLLGTLESELERYTQDYILKKLKTADDIKVFTSEWPYTIRQDRRSGKDLLSFSIKQGIQQGNKKEYEKSSEITFKALQMRWKRIVK